jgi:hypothetical protein
LAFLLCRLSLWQKEEEEEEEGKKTAVFVKE